MLADPGLQQQMAPKINQRKHRHMLRQEPLGLLVHRDATGLIHRAARVCHELVIRFVAPYFGHMFQSQSKEAVRIGIVRSPAHQAEIWRFMEESIKVLCPVHLLPLHFHAKVFSPPGLELGLRLSCVWHGHEKALDVWKSDSIGIAGFRQ